MFVRFQALPQVFLAFLLAASSSSSVLADSWGERKDIGVAALDRKTGKVLWEAWQPDQIPAELSKAGRAAVEGLLLNGGRSRESEEPSFPAAVARDRVVDYDQDAEENPCVILAHGKPGAIGAVIARFSIDDNARWRNRVFNGTLYRLHATQVSAFPTTIKEEPKDKKWEPSWTFDLLADLLTQERAGAELLPMELHVNAKGVWVVHGPRILQLTPDGRKKVQYTLKRVPWTWLDHHMGTPLTFGEHLIYHRSVNVVIALDWQRKQEVWRLETTLAPTISRVVEIERDLVVAQIGSSVPGTIRQALFSDGNSSTKRSRSTRERIAAASLLHSYGDACVGGAGAGGRKEAAAIGEPLRPATFVLG